MYTPVHSEAYGRYPKMRFEIACLLALAAVSAYATTAVDPSKPERFLISTGSITFTTFTVVKYSTTVTTTFTSTTSCTTSTAALTTCTIGRRRRGLFYDEASAKGRDRRGLFYTDEEVDNQDGSAFLPSEKSVSFRFLYCRLHNNNVIFKYPRASDPVAELGSTTVDESSVVPLEIEAGFSIPNNSGPNRFLLAIGTSTITSIVVTSTTISLTAFCASTSGFPVCGGAGK